MESLESGLYYNEVADSLEGTGLASSANVYTLADIPEGMKKIAKYTSNEVKKIFKSAVSNGKRYQKIGNTILSTSVAIGSALEGAVRTVITPTAKFIGDKIKTGKNKIRNIIKSTLGSTSATKLISKPKYETLKTKNFISTWRLNRFKNKEGKNIQQNVIKSDNTSNEKVLTTEKKSTQNVKTLQKENVSQKVKQVSTIKNTEIVEHEGVKEAKAILADSPCGKIVIDRLCERYKEFRIIFDNTTSMGRCNEDHTITIGTKVPNGIPELAPFNWKNKNSDFQKKHLLLHELSHGVVYSHAEEIHGIQEGLNLIEKYIEGRKNIDGKTLSMLSYNNNVYKTIQEKAREDFVEMLALRMNGNGNFCKKYLELLSDDEHRSFRETHGLVTITKEDASKLQNIFDEIIKYYGC